MRTGKGSGLRAQGYEQGLRWLTAALSVQAFALASAACARSPSPPPARPNVLLVTIDTFRADRVGIGLAPAIDRLAAAGLRFTTARTAVPLTLPSHTTIHTGLLPPVHGVRENGIDMLAPTHQTLATLLKGAGYETAAFVGAFVLDHRFGLAQGFDTYDDHIPRDPEASDRLEAERPASAVIDRALAWFVRQLAPSPQPRAPFFVWLHLYDPHAPYNPPAEFRARTSSPYDGEIAYADAQLARLLDALRARGVMDRTIVVVAGDHGEGLGEHGERTHGMLVYDSTLRVPLILAGPGIAAATSDEPVSLVDLAPTLLNAAGVTPPAEMKGRDLLDIGPTHRSAPTQTDRSAPTLTGAAPIGGAADPRTPADAGTDQRSGTETDRRSGVGADRRSGVGADWRSGVGGDRRSGVGADLRVRPMPDLYSETEYPRVAGWSPLQALTDGRWMTIRAGAATEVYDLLHDPREEHDVAASQSAVASAMGARADALHISAAASASRSISPEAQERLRALGYVASSAAPSSTTGAPNPASHIAAWNAFEDALAALSAHRADALPALRRLAAANPDAPVIQTTAARAMKEGGQTAAALAAYRQAAARWPTDALLLHDLAVVAREAAASAPAPKAATLRDEAARADQAALVLAPDSAAAHNGLGLQAIETGKAAAAVQAFERATALDSNNAAYWANLGNARRAAGDRAGAEQAYHHALDVDARTADAANGLGVLLVEANRPADAAPWFERAIAAAPDLVEARLNLGIALQQSGQPARAADAYRLVVAARGNHAREKDAAAKLLAGLGAVR